MSAAPSFPPGWFVHPCHRNSKKPILPDWPALASDDPAQIAAWTNQFQNCNWALACGPSGIAVIDIDGGETGEASLFQFQLNEGFLPETREHRSARGGRHLIFSDPDRTLRNSASRLGPKLDTRGGNGFIVVPPSTFEGGSYEVLHDRPVAALPVFVSAAVARDREHVAAAGGVSLDSDIAIGRAARLLKDYVARRHVAIEDEGGDDRTYAVCAEVLSLGVSEDKALEIIGDIWNVACVPPWDIEELRGKIENAAAYAQNEPGAFAVRPTRERIPAEALERLIADSEDAKRANPNGSAPNKFRVLRPSTMRSLPEPSWLVNGIIPARSVVLLYGPSGSYKTFVLLEILLSVATGRPAFGTAAVMPGGAVFCAGEGPLSIARKRWPAWAAARGIGDPDAVPFGLIASVPLVSDAADIDALILAIRESGLKPVALAIDTAARALAGLDENSAKDTGLLIAAAEKLRRDLDCAVLICHHAGKDSDRGARGSSAIEAGVDAVFKVDAEPDVLAVNIRCTKQKDADETPPIFLKGRVAGASLVFDQIAASEHKALTTPGDDLAPGFIGSVLRRLKAIGKAEAVTTNVLAVEILNVTLKSQPGGEHHERDVNALGQKLKALARDGRLSGFAEKDGAGATAPWAWYLPDGEASQ